jgi:DNA (cytosine-5)-methyltransferase 1
MIHRGDITKINGYEVEPVEVIIAGSPCQDLSVAGKRAGLDGERSGLFMEQIRIIKEMRANDRRNGRTDESVRPRYMVWENVPGAFSSNKGEDFRIVLEETAKIADPEISIPRPPQGKWTNSGCIVGRGYSIAWRVLDAQYFGVPQRRRRIALVADFGGETAPEILFKSESLSGNIEPSGTERERTAGDAERSLDKAISFQERSGCAGGVKESSSSTIEQAHSAPLTINQYCGINGDIAETLDASYYKGYGERSNKEREVVLSIENHPNDSRVKIIEDGKVQALSSRMGTGGNNTPMCMCIGNGQVDNTGLHEVAGALNCMHDQQTVMTWGLDRAAYNQGKNAKYNFSVEQEKIGAQVAKGPGAIATQSIVRRLTPMECERLQGYPDGWTDIGEWTDSKGKKHKDADSPRYKALGNSIAVPCWRFILQGINENVTEHTMASLFDGIGGFPLIWESLNGSKSCRWVSEIEEFPIAVTKKRFEQE